MKRNRNALAAQRIDTAPAAAALDTLVARAAALHRQGSLPEAEGLYRDVLTLNPRHADALHLLGVIAHQCERSAAAVDLIEKALAEKPREPIFHYSIGLALHALKRTDDAIRHFKRAFALKPDFSEAAVRLGLALLFAGHADDAINAAARALAIDGNEEAKELFVECLRYPLDVARLAPVQPVILRALQERWARPALLAHIVGRMVSESGPLAKAMKTAQTAWPQRLPTGALDLAHAQSHVLLRALLVSTPVCSTTLERYLTSVRSELLDRSLSPRPNDDDILPLACALARQCFINEYVFACSDAEAEKLAGLTSSLSAALAAGQPVSPLQLAAVAAYASLDSVLPADALLARDWPQPIKELLVQQVEEPATERRLRAAIPRLTPVKDSVSRAVQAQYEDHPYPRWTFSAAKVPAWAPFASAREILIAGCGTGRQLCEMASLNTTAHVLAVDLSLASLSYATRKAHELGLKNVEIAQADILELGSLGRTFDFIDSSGVLHHLGDPWTGWRVLLSLLQPGGAMRVALYSELARRPLVAPRTFIAERAYSSSTEDIRRFRQDAMGEPDLTLPTGSHDFYTVSSLRDLLFHVQETRMTLPEIKAFLAQNGLEFLGFDIASTVLEAFRNRFPHKGAHTDLDCWHVFEQERPSVFVGMYQFDVKKR